MKSESILGRTIQRRRERQGGAVVVEQAFTLVPLLSFIFATMDIAMAVTMQNTVQFASRQGVRYAITSQLRSGMNHDESVKFIVVANSMGMMPYLMPTTGGPPTPSTNPYDYITIRYYDPSTLSEVTGAGSNRGGNICRITITGLRYSWMGPLTRGTTALNMSAASSDVMEASPNGVPPTR